MQEKIKKKLFNLVNLIIFTIYLFLFFTPNSLNSKISIGLPISNAIEYLIVIFLIYFFFKNYKNINQFKPNIIVMFILILLSVLRIVTFYEKPIQIEACYKFEIFKPNSNCLKSWDNISKSEITRFENQIYYGAVSGDLFDVNNIQESNWNISGLNSLEYNSFDSIQTERLRPPLHVTWNFFNLENEKLKITLRGNLIIYSDNNLIYHKENYSNNKFDNLNIESNKNIKIKYSFNPSKSNKYGVLLIQDSKNTIFTPDQKLLIQLLELLESIVTIFLVLIIIYFQKKYFKKIIYGKIISHLIFFILLNSFIFFMLKYNKSTESFIEYFNLLRSPYLSRSIFLSIFFNSIIFIFKTKYLKEVLFILTPIYSYFLAYIFSPFPLSKVFYKMSGEDFLTYESLSREIFINKSLQGGEDIFIYSPAIRYFNFILHYIFGDSDFMIHYFYLSMLILFSCLFFVNLTKINNSTKLNQIILFFYILLFSFFIGYRTIFYGASTLFSEYPTWIIIIILFIYLINYNSTKYLNILIILSGSLVLFRANQLPASILFLSVFLFLTIYKKYMSNKKIFLIKKIGLFLITLSPIMIHNYFYGGKIVFLQTSLPLQINFPLSPIQLITNPLNSSSLEVFFNQLNGVLAQHIYIEYFKFPIMIIQISYIIFIISNLRFLRLNCKYLFIILIPISFLLPHLFIQVLVYYPRHIVAGYLSMLLVVGLLINELSINERKMKINSETYKD